MFQTQTQKDIKYVFAVQGASTTSIFAWYPIFKMTTLGKEGNILSRRLSRRPNNMLHMFDFYHPTTFYPDDFKSIKGFSAYYRGILPAMTLFPICLFGKELLSRKLFDSKPNIYQDCMLAAGVGCATAFVATPLNVDLIDTFRNNDILRTNMLMNREYHQKRVIKHFYSGLSAFATRNALFCTSLTVVYPKTQEAIATQYPQVVPFKADILAAGVCSAIVFSGSFFLDFVRVMRQSPQYSGDSASSLLKMGYVTNGVKGLFYGFSPKIAQVTAEIIVFNETFKYLMRYLNGTN